MPDRSEYAAYMKVLAAQRRGEAVPTPPESRAAAVHDALLTQDPAWDHFLARLRAMEASATEERTALEKKFHDPGFVDVEAAATCRNCILQLTARIETLESVMKLPRDLKKGKK